MEIDKCQDRFGRMFWSKSSFDYSDLKLKVFKKDGNKEFQLVQNLTMVETDINRLIRLGNLLVVAVRDFSREETVPLVRVKLLAKNTEEQFKLTQKVVEIVDQPHRKICVTILR